jgi:hypothetical protein
MIACGGVRVGVCDAGFDGEVIVRVCRLRLAPCRAKVFVAAGAIVDRTPIGWCGRRSATALLLAANGTARSL